MTERTAHSPKPTATSRTEPYAIDWVDLTQAPGLVDAAGAGGALGMSHAPGVTDPVKGRDRDVATDVAALRDVHHADTLLLLLGDDELPMLEIADLPTEVEASGVDLLRYPIPDFGVPADEAAFADVVDEVLKRLRSGQRVVVACRAGFGRTGTVTGSLLRAAGLGPGESIALVRATRPGTIERDAQAAFVAYWAR